MHIVHVFISVKEEFVSAFREATLHNARHSLEEPGVVRFDVLQQQDKPTEFMLEEVYRSREDQMKHRESNHFKKWKETTAEMFMQPYSIRNYSNIYPETIAKMVDF